MAPYRCPVDRLLQLLARRSSRPLPTFPAASCVARAAAAHSRAEEASLDGRPLGVLVRAVTDGEVVRLGVDELDALARLRPDLARAILFDLGRILAGRLRHSQSPARASVG